MRTRRILLSLAASTAVCACLAYGQDSPSLGDVARQARLQKQQKDVPAKDAAAKGASNKNGQANDVSTKDAATTKSTHVITNDEIPSHAGSTVTSTGSSKSSGTPDAPQKSLSPDAGAEQWKSQILAQKNAIATLQHELASLSDSIHYAGGNCVANCVQWNERQKQKEDQVESMKAQLEELQKHLEDMQDSARKQGFGNSVYDP